MSDPFLLIDGYNLMYAGGMISHGGGPGGFERARNRFLKFLSSNLTSRERKRTTVVFDAPASSNRSASPQRQYGLTVQFAHAQFDADDIIEDLIAGHSAPRQILLVSSDHRLQKAVRRRRGKFIDSEDFATLLEERSELQGEESPGEQLTPEQQGKRTGLHSSEEISAWSEEFGEIPEARRLGRQLPEIDLDALEKEIESIERESNEDQ